MLAGSSFAYGPNGELAKKTDAVTLSETLCSCDAHGNPSHGHAPRSAGGDRRRHRRSEPADRQEDRWRPLFGGRTRAERAV